MNVREFHYVLVEDDNNVKKITFKNDNKKEKLVCLKNDALTKDDKKNVIGYIHRKNSEYTGDEYATLHDAFSHDVDIFKKKRFYEHIIGYVKTSDDKYIAVTQNFLLLIFFLCFCITTLCAITITANYSAKSNTSTDISIIQPESTNDDVSDIPSDDESSIIGLTMYVDLATTEITFDGKIYEYQDETQYLKNTDKEGSTYSGNASVEVSMLTNNVSNVILKEYSSSVKDGQLDATNLVYPDLSFEITSGIYEGTTHFVYADGQVVDIPTQIIIRSSTSGTIGIGYSTDVNVNLDASRIELKYSLLAAVYDTYIEVIIKDGSDEYVIGKSGTISNNQKLTGIALIDTMKSRITTGTYSGVIRVYPINASSDAQFDIHTDIDVTITVK